MAQMTKAYIESERNTVRHIREVRVLLTDDQREKYDALLAQCVCAPCEARANSDQASHSCAHKEDGEGQ